VLQDSVDAVRKPDQARSSRWSLAALLIVLAAIAWPFEVASRRLPAPAMPRWLRERLATMPTATEQATPVPGQSGTAIPGQIASQPATTTRLLERTRSLRQQRRR
jgi:hypothetical protein